MERLYLLPEMPGVSIAIWVVFSMIFLFFARDPMHRLIHAMSDATAGGLRKIASWIKISVDKEIFLLRSCS